jgi:hypothetical protein
MLYSLLGDSLASEFDMPRLGIVCSVFVGGLSRTAYTTHEDETVFPNVST